MEPSTLFSSYFAIFVITLIAIGVLKVIGYLYNQHTYWKKRGVPHISTISGYAAFGKFLARRINFLDYCEFIYNYDPDSKYLGSMEMSTPAVFLRDPELIKDITVKDFEHFPDHRSFAEEMQVEPMFSKNIFALRGDQWRIMRNTLSPSFTASKMKFMYELISKCSREFVEYLTDHPEECSSINTKEVFRRYTTDVIATSAFGISVNSMRDRDNEFFLNGIKFTNIGTIFMFIKALFSRAFPRLSRKLGIRFFPKSMSEFFKNIVAETIKVREEHGTIRPDMIHLLMQAQNKEGPSEYKMTLDDIVAQAFIFFLAGFETSATVMCFVAHELAVHPDIQDRLREEVEKHFAEGNGEISYEAVSKMVYMDMVLSETLRRYPPQVFVDRLCVKRYELPPAKPGMKSVVIEPNNVIIMMPYALHNDSKYFPNPSKFDPERFSEENKDNIIPYTYMPFGHGPRKCIGNRFALMETKLLLAHLLHKFVFKPTEKTVYPIVFGRSPFQMEPKGGFWIALEKREN